MFFLVSLFFKKISHATFKNFIGSFWFDFEQ